MKKIVRLPSGKVVGGMLKREHDDGRVTIEWGGITVIGTPLTPAEIAKLEQEESA